MQAKVNPLVAVAVGVVIIALAVFFYVRSGAPSGAATTRPSTAYTNPGPNNHP